MKTFPAVLCFILIVLTLSVTPLLAQDSTTVNSLQKGNWALQFEVYGGLIDFQLRDFLGTTFSGKWHIADRRALRVGVSLDGDYTNYNIDRDDNGSSFDRTISQNGINSSHNIDIIMHHVWYVRENNGFFLFTGLGPMIGLDIRKSDDSGRIDYTEETETDVRSHSKSSRYSTFLGLSGALGLEYFIVRNVSLSAEFQSNIGYFFSREKRESRSTHIGDPERDRTNTVDYKSDGFRYDSNRVKVGLSIYF